MDWPYDDDDETAADTEAPTWDCPDESCQCHKPEGKGEEVEFSVMLLAPTGERMAGAICRIRHQGRVINESQPTADGSGWVTAKIPHAPATVLVEWAPPDAPKNPGYPYKTRYYVELGEARREAGRRRLHNLGYSRRLSLRDNVEAFQRDYGYEKVTGELDDIEDDLILFHDEGQAPITTPESEPADGVPPSQGHSAGVPVLEKDRDGTHSLVPSQSKAKLGPQDKGGGATGGGGHVENQPPKKLPPQDPAAKPKSEGAKSKGQGTCKKTPDLPTIAQAIADMGKDPKANPKAKPALFEWVRVSITWTDPKDASRFMSGIFWMFSDAMMVELPNDAEWGFWKGTKFDQPLPKNPINATITDRKRLVRLPCMGKQAQAAMPSLAFSQAELIAADGGSILGLPSPTKKDKLESLMPTAELYNHCYANANVRIPFQQVAITSCLGANALVYAEKVSEAIEAARNASKPPTTARLLGTPGKIWAIGDRMDTWVWCTDPRFPHWSYACLNHGFHTKLTGTDKFGRPTVHAFQTTGACHDWFQIDYSQIFQAVAGWCLVKRFSDTKATWWPTADVYSHSELCKLVRDSTPVPALKYVGNVKNTPHPATHP